MRKKVLKATIFSIIVAFFVSFLISSIFIKFGKDKFLMATGMLDMITIDNDNTDKALPELKEYVVNNDMGLVSIDGINGTQSTAEGTQQTKMILTNCPAYSENYARLVISSAGIDLPIYYGKSLDLLKNGVGHDNDSRFPGEGGSIILMGHNFKKLLGNLPKAQVGDNIHITTHYGEFDYTIYDTKIIGEDQTFFVPVQYDEEILMIYTCWPINNIGYTTQRYVVYAK